MIVACVAIKKERIGYCAILVLSSFFFLLLGAHTRKTRFNERYG